MSIRELNYECLDSTRKYLALPGSSRLQYSVRVRAGPGPKRTTSLLRDTETEDLYFKYFVYL